MIQLVAEISPVNHSAMGATRGQNNGLFSKQKYFLKSLKAK